MSNDHLRELGESIAYCGLICKMCGASDHCDGCRSCNNTCATHNSRGGCDPYNCCVERKIDGCWDCADFPCDKPFFTSPKAQFFVMSIEYIREHGKDDWIKHCEELRK